MKDTIDCGTAAAFEEHLNSVYFDGYAETLSREDYNFLLAEFLGA